MLDCQTCGVCCINALPDNSYIGLSFADLRRLTPDEIRRFVVRWGRERRPYLRTTRHPDGDNRCVALAGVVGESVACTIYERRPEVCRRFEKDAPFCYGRREARLDD